MERNWRCRRVTYGSGGLPSCPERLLRYWERWHAGKWKEVRFAVARQDGELSAPHLRRRPNCVGAAGRAGMTAALLLAARGQALVVLDYGLVCGDAAGERHGGAISGRAGTGPGRSEGSAAGTSSRGRRWAGPLARRRGHSLAQGHDLADVGADVVVLDRRAHADGHRLYWSSWCTRVRCHHVAAMAPMPAARSRKPTSPQATPQS